MEAAYKNLLFADAESAKAFEDLKKNVAGKDPEKIRISLAVYEKLHEQHHDSWWKVSDGLFKFSEAADRLFPSGLARLFAESGQWDQYFAWYDFVSDGWKKVPPNTKETIEVVGKAWKMIRFEPAFPNLPRLARPRPKGQII